MIISILLNGDKSHKPVFKTIKILNDLEISMKISKRTVEEFNNKIIDTETLYLSKKQASSDVLVGVADLMPDPFISTYWLELEENDKLEWVDFITPLKNARLILDDKYNIKYDNRDHEDIVTSTRISSLQKFVSDTSRDKSERVVQHDSFHILLIQKLRDINPGDEYGPRYWFLTRDASLSMAESIYDPSTIPASVYLTVFLDIISPLLIPETSITEFGDVFTNMIGTIFTSFAEQLSPIDVLNLARDYTDDPDLSIRTIRTLIGDRWVRDNLEQIRTLPSTSERYIRIMSQLEERVKDELKQYKPPIVMNKLLMWVIILFGSIIVDLLSYIFIENPPWFWLIGTEITILLGFPKLHEWLTKRT